MVRSLSTKARWQCFTARSKMGTVVVPKVGVIVGVLLYCQWWKEFKLCDFPKDKIKGGSQQEIVQFRLKTVKEIRSLKTSVPGRGQVFCPRD